MNSDELIQSMRRAAERCVANGETSKEIYKRAAEQERTGFSISAPYTRLLATLVKGLEEGK